MYTTKKEPMPKGEGNNGVVSVLRRAVTCAAERGVVFTYEYILLIMSRLVNFLVSVSLLVFIKHVIRFL